MGSEVADVGRALDDNHDPEPRDDGRDGCTVCGFHLLVSTRTLHLPADDEIHRAWAWLAEQPSAAAARPETAQPPPPRVGS